MLTRHVFRVWLAALVVALSVGLAAPLYAQSGDTLPSLEGLDRATPANIEQVKQLQGAVKRLVNHVRPTVVGLRIGQAGGSGTLISADGWIMTAAHVTTGANKPCDVFLWDGTRLRGRTMGLNSPNDYALVKAETNGRELPFVAMGNSDTVAVGQWIVSMGHPLGTETSPFRPPVVRLGRVIAKGAQIVADAPLISGDSGGPMFDLHGNLMGINVSIDISRVEVNNATPINDAKAHMDRLRAGESFGGRGASLAQYDDGITKAYELLDGDKFAEAVQAFENVIKLDEARADGYYHLACCYLRQMQKEQGEKAREMRAKAFEKLNAAVEKGWNNLEHMGWDPDMNVIRDTDEFRQIVLKIRRALGQQPYLGLSGAETNGNGVRVTSIAEKSSADRAGIKVGDVVVNVGDADIKTKADLIGVMSDKRPGDELVISVTREGRTLELACVLGGRDQQARSNNKNSADVRMLFGSACEKAAASTVRIVVNRRVRGFGVVVREDGLILCKASEISGRDPRITVGLSNGDSFDGKKLVDDEQLDIALIKIATTGLTPISWGDETAVKLGDFLASVGSEAVPFTIGVRSLDSYQTLRPQDAPFLGVGLEEVPEFELNNLGIEGGALITQVTGRSGADRAGLRAGDIIVRVGEKAITSPDDLIAAVRGHRVGDTLDFFIFRDGSAVERPLRATLGRRGAESGLGNMFESFNPMMNRVKGPVNQRADGFGEVIQHDGVVLPQQVGSPIVDIDGNVVGLNIGRSDRTKTYAIPATVIKGVLPRMLRQADAAAEDY